MLCCFTEHDLLATHSHHTPQAASLALSLSKRTQHQLSRRFDLVQLFYNAAIIQKFSGVFVLAVFPHQ